MKQTTKNSTFLITSSTNRSFGTAFCIDSNEKGSFLVTAAHVIHDCGEESLLVENQEATLIAIGDNQGIDLAVLFVHNLTATPLNLNSFPLSKNIKLQVEGFKSHLNDHKLELLNGVVKKISKLKTDHQVLNIYELNFNDDNEIERGYSGSAVVSQEYVFAVVVSRYSQTHADAIPIEYLKDIWNEMPPTLLQSVPVEKISGTLEPQTLFNETTKTNKKSWLKYLLSLLFVLLIAFIIWKIPYIHEANELSRFDEQIQEVYMDWEGVAKYKHNEQKKAEISEKATLLAEKMESLDDHYLKSIQNISEKYERLSYAYGIASHMYNSPQKKISLAQKSIDAGKRALDFMNKLPPSKERRDKIGLIIAMDYIIQYQAGEKELLNEAKRRYQEIEPWYHSANHITNQIDVIDAFIEKSLNERE